ncbi:MAG: DUF2116 family Zn-ribbon domain-containing protein [Terriglobia bacterium]
MPGKTYRCRNRACPLRGKRGSYHRHCVVCGHPAAPRSIFCSSNGCKAEDKRERRRASRVEAFIRLKGERKVRHVWLPKRDLPWLR